MRYSAKLKKYKDKQALITFDRELNTERLRTMYDGDISEIQAEVIFRDPRRFRPKQRALFFALLGDIEDWSGQEIEAPIEYIGDIKYLKNQFYAKYVVKHLKPISIADDSNSSVSDLNNLIGIVLEFMFEWGVPFKEGYELLPTNESYYLYLCAKHRKCVVCGSHADIHHIDAVGNRKRVEIDHRDLLVIALCRKHHNEAHNLGNTNFLNKHQVRGIKLDGPTLVRLGLMTKRQLANFEEDYQAE